MSERAVLNGEFEGCICLRKIKSICQKYLSSVVVVHARAVVKQVPNSSQVKSPLTITEQLETQSESITNAAVKNLIFVADAVDIVR